MGISTFVNSVASSISKPSSELEIELEEPARAGQDLKGVVTLKISEEGSTADSLELTLCGKEKVSIHYTKRTDNEVEDHHQHAEHEFFAVDIELAHFDGRISPGEYKYPFSAKLPSNLPAAFHISQHSTTSGCSIDYEVNARLRRPGKLSRDARASADLKPMGGKPVSSAAADGQSLEFGPTTVPIKMCGCFSRGTMSIGALATSHTFARGKTATIKVAARNDSRSNCSKVEVKLVQEVKLSAFNHRDRIRKTLGTQEMDGGTMGLGRSLMNDGNFARACETAAADISERLHSARNPPKMFGLLVDKDAMTSFNGEHITVEHCLKVIMDTPFGQTDPEVTAPIAVVDEEDNEKADVISNRPTAEDESKEEVKTDSNEGTSEEATGLEPLVKALAYSSSPERDVNAFNDQHPNTLATLTPEEFAMVCASATPLDQVKAAGAIAGYMSNGPTCSHIAELVKKASSLVRVDIVKLLAPSCTNLEDGKQLILEELSEFEGMQCKSCLNVE